MSLHDYYVANYSKCDVKYNFLASWKGVAYPSHLIQVISFPFQILTFYVIIKKTPRNMKSVAWPLFLNHFLCALLDFALCTLSTVYFFLPIFGIFGVGLLSWLGIPFIVQLIFGVIIGISAVCSYVYLFESRSSSLLQNWFRISKKPTRIIYHGIIFFYNCAILLVFFKTPFDQEAAKLEALTMYPCPTREFFDFPVLIVVSDQQSIRFLIYIFLPSMVFQTTANILFHVLCTVYYLYIAPSKSVSTETQKNQKSFLIGILFQTSIPLVNIAAPLVILLVAHSLGLYSQEMMNLSAVFVGFHGLVESIAIVTVHHHYRKSVKRMFLNKICKQHSSSVFVGTHHRGSNSLWSRGAI